MWLSIDTWAVSDGRNASNVDPEVKAQPVGDVELTVSKAYWVHRNGDLEVAIKRLLELFKDLFEQNDDILLLGVVGGSLSLD